mgnify:FL=1|tara:strand:- start:935 stop:1309 length:375 start_codon:yes stop_codon:yes gene_type:complete
MRNFRNNFKKNRFRSNSDRYFKRNGSNINQNSGLADNAEFKRKKNGRNINAPKLIEKYLDLAKEALSNGDKILSENYFQHADHFSRVLEKQNLSKDGKKIFQENENIVNGEEESSTKDSKTNNA